MLYYWPSWVHFVLINKKSHYILWHCHWKSEIYQICQLTKYDCSLSIIHRSQKGLTNISVNFRFFQVALFQVDFSWGAHGGGLWSIEVSWLSIYRNNCVIFLCNISHSFSNHKKFQAYWWGSCFLFECLDPVTCQPIKWVKCSGTSVCNRNYIASSPQQQKIR